MFAVMSPSELAQVADPLVRAAQANDLMWTDHPDRAGLRVLRAQAIREALANGYAAADVADRLGVVVADLAWMVNDSPTWPYRAKTANGAVPGAGQFDGHPEFGAGGARRGAAGDAAGGARSTPELADT